MSQSVRILPPTLCLVALFFNPLSAAFAQGAAPEEAVGESSTPVVAAQSAIPTERPVDDAATEVAEESASGPFQLPVEQHPWARFQPGAWREIQITSETYGEEGVAISRSVTKRKEVLQVVADDKYVLDVQATVNFSGKEIVGDKKTLALYLATDGAGALLESRRLTDQTFQLPGRAVDCQVWEISYRDGARYLTDHVFYDAMRYPFILQRATYVSDVPVESRSGSDLVEPEQRIDLTASAVPYRFGEQLLECSCLRTFRQFEKGETLRLTFTSRVVPGGEVAVWSTDSDAQGRPVGSSVAQLLAYGGTSPSSAALPGPDSNEQSAPLRSSSSAKEEANKAAQRAAENRAVEKSAAEFAAESVAGEDPLEATSTDDRANTESLESPLEQTDPL